MGFVKEFRDFIVKGNAIDMAVGLVIGAAFGGVVTSLVKDIIMPPLGYVMAGIDFAALKYKMADAMVTGQIHPVTKQLLEKDMPEVAINFGLFINALIALVIQGFAIFLVVKLINALKRQEAVAPSTAPPPDIALLTEIRDLLKHRS